MRSFTLDSILFQTTVSQQLDQRFRKGNMTSIDRMFAGVRGKIIEFISSCLGLEEEPHIFIKFDDGTALEIEIESRPYLAAEWRQVKDGELESVPWKVFE